MNTSALIQYLLLSGSGSTRNSLQNNDLHNLFSSTSAFGPGNAFSLNSGLSSLDSILNLDPFTSTSTSLFNQASSPLSQLLLANYIQRRATGNTETEADTAEADGTKTIKATGGAPEIKIEKTETAAATDIAPVSTDAKEFVKSVYVNLLGREAESDQVVKDWADQVTINGVVSAVTNIIESPEFKSHNYSRSEIVTRIYRTMLGREPGTTEVQLWSDSNVSVPEMIQRFFASDEFTKNANTPKFTAQAGAPAAPAALASTTAAPAEKTAAVPAAAPADVGTLGEKGFNVQPERSTLLNSCGTAAVAAALTALGVPGTLQNLNAIYRPDQTEHPNLPLRGNGIGIREPEMKQAAELYGVNAEIYLHKSPNDVTDADFKMIIDDGYAAVLGINRGEGPHAITLLGYKISAPGQLLLKYYEPQDGQIHYASSTEVRAWLGGGSGYEAAGLTAPITLFSKTANFPPGGVSITPLANDPSQLSIASKS